jgi:hypothetical protein
MMFFCFLLNILVGYSEGSCLICPGRSNLPFMGTFTGVVDNMIISWLSKEKIDIIIMILVQQE